MFTGLFMRSERMKTYLNRAERERYCVVALSAAILGKILEEWENNLTKDEHRAIKTAQTYIFKFMDSVKNRMDNDFIHQLIRDIKSSEIQVLPTLAAKREYEKRSIEDEHVQVNRETILNLAEHALIGCEGCKKDKDFRKCDLRQVYMELGIEPFDFEASNKCQYKVNYKKKGA
jgi:hypothetical protein